MHLIPLATPLSWSTQFERLGALALGAGSHAVDYAIALALMLAGWGLATLADLVVRRTLVAVRFDAAVARAVGARFAEEHVPSALAGWAAYWLVLAGVTLFALETLGLDLLVPIAERLVEVVPRIVTSALLFIVGALLAMLSGAVAGRFLESAGFRAARLASGLVTFVLIGFAALVALEQLGFAAQFVMAIGVVAAGATGLGLALAFGLGCRDLARDFLVEYLRSLDERPGPNP